MAIDSADGLLRRCAVPSDIAARRGLLRPGRARRREHPPSPLVRGAARAHAVGTHRESAMNCIACGREGHNSAGCPLQLWKWAAPAPVAQAAPMAARAALAPALPGQPALHLDSHDRAREAWLQFA